MFLFKTSGATLKSVVLLQKHAFRGRPSAWHRGEHVLVSKNRADCARGERQVQYIMNLDHIRPLKKGEAELYWPGNEGRWQYLFECMETRKLRRSFDLDEVLGEEAAAYGPVMTYKRFSPTHEKLLREFLARIDSGQSQ